MYEEKSTQLSREEINQYLEDLKSGDTKERAIAAYMLGTHGKNDKKIKQSLKEALKDKNFEVKKWAALSLGEMGEKDSKIVPILIKVLRSDENNEFRTHAAIILGELEKQAIPALPALHSASQENNTRLRDWACWAVNKIVKETTNYRISYPKVRPKLSDRIRFIDKESE
ncbi:MAG: hypothetical protein GF308_22000 [Candidatus Heimdallarchaeota archaeon]|nr:hypothetical protein [Candidatus Heimdallarchaeota archaeon]